MLYILNYVFYQNVNKNFNSYLDNININVKVMKVKMSLHK